MPGNDGSGIHRLEFIKRRYPFAPALRGGFGQVGMNSVIDGSPDEQFYRRNM